MNAQEKLCHKIVSFLSNEQLEGLMTFCGRDLMNEIYPPPLSAPLVVNVCIDLCKESIAKIKNNSAKEDILNHAKAALYTTMQAIKESDPKYNLLCFLEAENDRLKAENEELKKKLNMLGIKEDFERESKKTHQERFEEMYVQKPCESEEA